MNNATLMTNSAEPALEIKLDKPAPIPLFIYLFKFDLVS